jgi:hypothetical protein
MEDEMSGAYENEYKILVRNMKGRDNLEKCMHMEG